MKKNSFESEAKIIKADTTKLILDQIDRKILVLLQKNNQLTNLELAELVDLSPPSCLKRTRRLRESGIITQDVSLIDPFKIKQNLISFISISLEKHGEDFLNHFEQKMKEFPEVKQCYFISGDVDYLLMVHVTDIDAYNQFVRRLIANLPNMKSFRSSFCLSRIIFDTSVMLDEE